MVINFGVQNRVVALWKSLSEAIIKKARNVPSNQLPFQASRRLFIE
jgi:hypothetical protein